MDDTISRKAAIVAIEEIFCNGCQNYNGVLCGSCDHSDDIDIIEGVPSSVEEIEELLRECQSLLRNAIFANYKDTKKADELYDKLIKVLQKE